MIFVRHGESRANSINGAGYQMFTGQWDCELTEAGEKQAADLAGSPVFDDVDCFFVSDLLRTRQTASYFADPEKTVIDKRLRERSLGAFEGKNVEDVKADPLYRKYFTDPAWMNFRHDFTVRAPEGENYSDVCRRTGEFLEEVKQKGYHKIVIVAHFCSIRCMMKQLLGLSEEETVKIRVDQCRPIEVEV